MKLYKEDLQLYFVTNDDFYLKRSLEEMVEEAIKGGATIIQYREKEKTFTERLLEANELSKLCKKYNVPFIINDDIELAKSVPCDGVHVGQNDESIKTAIEHFGDDFIYGVSVTNLEEAKKALSDGATYIGVGTMFPTSTKDDAVNVSFDELKRITDHVKLPVVAIGGITESNIYELKDLGIDGVALVSEIINNTDIAKKCNSLLSVVKEVVRPNTLLLDIDGTLVDSMEFYYQLPRMFLSKYGVLIEDEVLDDIQQMSFAESTVYLKGELDCDISIDRISSELTKLVKEYYMNDVLLNNDVLDFVDQEYQFGMKIIIYSAAYKENISSVVNKFRLETIVDSIYGAEDFKNNKQDKEALSKLFKVLHKEPSELIGIDDNQSVIDAYKTLGINVIHYGIEDKE